MNLNTLPKGQKITLSIVAFGLIILGFYLSVYKSFGYQSNIETIGNIMMILSIFLIPVLWLKTKENSKSKKQAAISLAVIITSGIGIVSLVIFSSMYAKENHLKKELKSYGIKTTAVITGFEYERNRSSTSEYATIQYEFESHLIVQRFEIFDNDYRIE